MREVEQFRSAQLYLDAGDPLGALEVLRTVGDALRQHAGGQLLLGQAYYLCAQFDRAQAALERAVALDPADHRARFELGRALERRSMLREALKHLRIAAAMSGRTDYQRRVEVVAAALGPTA